MDVLMPQLGETVAEGTISKWFVKAGDAVKPGDNLFEIETDKVSMEVPAIAAGTIATIHVQAGEVAPVGAVVAQIVGAGESATPSPPLTPAKAGVHGPVKKEVDSRLRGNERSMAATPAPKTTHPMEPFREVRSPERNYGPARLAGGIVITPLARRLAGEAGIDLTKIKGSGPHGRVVAADIETARKAPAPAMHGAATVALTADITIGQAFALCDEVKALELADVIVRAWATALRRVVPDAPTDIALAAGDDAVLIRDATSRSLTAIAAVRRQTGTATEAKRASSAIFIAQVPGIASVAHAVRPPQTTMLSIGSRRRTAVEAPNGSVIFGDMVTATLACDLRTIDAALGADLLSAFKGFVERPVTMLV